MIIRWVHPKKVDADGKLKPSAFLTKSIIGTFSLNPDGSCPHNAISLSDLNLLNSHNKAVANEAACKFCTVRIDRKHQWIDGSGCNCEHRDFGARGACSTEQVLNDLGFCIQNAAQPDNPLHVLLCACAKAKKLSLERIGIDKIQKLLIDTFAHIKSVESIFEEKL